MNVQREESRECLAASLVTLRPEGALDVGSARQLRARLRELRAVPVEVDFSRVTQFPAVAVPLLAPELFDPRVTVRGLGRHEARLFEYFGHSLTPTQAHPSWMEERS